jgi:carboxyl-terminal processing protease
MPRQSTARMATFLAVLSLCVSADWFSATTRAQTNPTPKYIPPSCQGKPITTVPRAVMLAQTPTEVKPNPPIAKADQLKLFNALARIIDDVYVYPDYDGLNWPNIVSEFRRKVDGGLDTEAFYTEMENFVKRLGDQHSYFESPVNAAANKTALAGGENYVGIGALLKGVLEKKLVTILAVMADSPAEHGGLTQHDSLFAVDGVPMVENGKVYQQRTRGPECSAAVLTVQSPGQTPRELMLVRHQVAGATPIYARLVRTRDRSRIGYIFLPSFFDTTLPGQIKKALLDFGSVDGLIIDNRMNTGGSGSVLLPILSYFASGALGHFVSRTATRPLEITANPIGNSQTVPLVILVSKDTVSFGEIFSGVLQDTGRARIVGQATAGRVETLHGFTFADGSRAWIAQERFDPTNSHADWRRRGVKPDVEVYADWETFTFDNDQAVAAAVKLLGHK